MKHIYIWITCMILPLAFFTGCDEDAVDPLTGKYPIPETYALTKLVGQSTAKNENGTRIFTLLLGMEGSSATYNEATDGFTAGSGQFLAVAFVGKDYFPETGTYSIAERASAKAGNYIAAYNDSGIDKGTYWHNSGSMAAVVSGNLSVKQSGNTYIISGTVTLADNSVIRISFEGTILYEADPEPPAPMALTNVFAVSAQPQEAGHQLITLKIATAGVNAIFNPATYGYDFEGNGNYISIDLLSNNANLDPGVYTPADNETATVGNFVKGYDTEMWGMAFYNWGSCWFEISDGTETGQHLTDGNITVSKSGNQYIITIETSVSDGSSIFAQYVGTIEGLGDNEEEPGEDYTYTLVESEEKGIELVSYGRLIKENI